jgi:hypothetical protein
VAAALSLLLDRRAQDRLARQLPPADGAPWPAAGHLRGFFHLACALPVAQTGFEITSSQSLADCVRTATLVAARITQPASLWSPRESTDDLGPVTRGIASSSQRPDGPNNWANPAPSHGTCQGSRSLSRTALTALVPLGRRTVAGVLASASSPPSTMPPPCTPSSHTGPAPARCAARLRPTRLVALT